MNKGDELVVMASEMMTQTNYQMSHCDDNLKQVLQLRKKMLNAKENWTWNEENKKRFVQISEVLYQHCQRGWKIAMEKATLLERQMARGAAVFDDYEISVRITPYMSDLWQTSDEVDEDTKESVSVYISEEYKPYIEMSISHCHYNNCAKEAREGDELFVNKEWNWNTEYLDGHFKDDYICFVMHRLLDSHEWSFGDICSIEKIWMDVEVQYQYCEEVPLSNEWRKKE